MLLAFYKKIWREAYDRNVLNIVSLLKPDSKAVVLDIGCGDGKNTVRFKRKISCKKMIGIDGLKKRLIAAKKEGVDETKIVDLEKKWPFPNRYFDIIISNQVIEHLIDIDNFIKEIYRLLKPDGYCVISSENLSSWHNVFTLALGYQDFSHTLIKKAHLGNPLSLHFREKTATWSRDDNAGIDDTAYPHLKILTYKSLVMVFAAYNFKFVKGLGSGYYPLFGILGRLANKIDPFHSHFITIKARKPF
jgi:2-polyprenyl-3-methyl-5-hydroxy-6-metoxy-1,4-benzoquinol methylase